MPAQEEPRDLSEPSPPPPADMAVAIAVIDMAKPRDLATPPDLTTIVDLATPNDLTVVAPCHLVINEVQTETSQAATEEFVEIFNPCGGPITVDGWKLVYRSAGNTSPRTSGDNSTLFTFAGSFASGAYRVIAGGGFLGTKDGALASGLATSGAVGLRDASSALVDSVAYGTAPGNTFAETATAPLPPSTSSPGGSIGRIPNGADHDNSSTDFVVAATRTPGAANH